MNDPPQSFPWAPAAAPGLTKAAARLWRRGHLRVWGQRPARPGGRLPFRALRTGACGPLPARSATRPPPALTGLRLRGLRRPPCPVSEATWPVPGTAGRAAVDPPSHLPLRALRLLPALTAEASAGPGTRAVGAPQGPSERPPPAQAGDPPPLHRAGDPPPLHRAPGLPRPSAPAAASAPPLLAAPGPGISAAAGGCAPPPAGRALGTSFHKGPAGAPDHVAAGFSSRYGSVRLLHVFWTQTKHLTFTGIASAAGLSSVACLVESCIFLSLQPAPLCLV